MINIRGLFCDKKSTLSGNIHSVQSLSSSRLWFSSPKQHSGIYYDWHKIKEGGAESSQLSFLLHQSVITLYQDTEKQTQVQLAYMGLQLYLLVIYKQQWSS